METNVLFSRLGEPRLKILDASYHVPPTPRNAQLEYEQTHLPGALFFDIDAISDTRSELPHMLPSPADFQAHMRRLGIGADDTLVVYDSNGMMSAPRAWWTFRYFGHERVYVLNGGLPKWLQENRPTESGPASAPTQPEASPFEPQPQPAMVIGLEDIRDVIDATTGKPRTPILDMRPAGRFTGAEPEPRAGLKRGHIPGSLSAPWASWLNEDKTLLSRPELEEKCRQLGLDWQNSAITTCGSGVTACVGAIALYELGNSQVAVYDGAWAEWGSREDTPIDSL